MTALGIFAVLAAAGLVGLRWLFADRREARTLELELHTRRVTVDQAELDKALALVKRLEERVKTLEYRPHKT